MVKLWKELSYERKWFIAFLLIHLLVWSCIGLIRQIPWKGFIGALCTTLVLRNIHRLQAG